ncbi:hypothetical protein PO124_28835 [Bacillus licheniformis]|nr:hypothetical protein [Bacillus licheniformis]
MLLFLTIAIFTAAGFQYKKSQLFARLHLLSSVLVANTYQSMFCLSQAALKRHESYLTSNEYNGEEQRRLLNNIRKDDKGDPYTRIDWMNGVRNNTPLMQDLTASAPTQAFSIAIFFCLLGRPSNRYGKGKRQPLRIDGRPGQLVQSAVRQVLHDGKDNAANVPYGFIQTDESEHYTVYKTNTPCRLSGRRERCLRKSFSRCASFSAGACDA